MFRPKLAVWLLIALVAAWLASCSSNVDGYHLGIEESGVNASTGGASQDSGGVGGASGSGGEPFVPTGGIGPRGGAGGGPAGGAPAGGAGGGNTGGADTGGAGGVQNGGAGGVITGGVQNGGNGGVTGGVPNTGGVPTGGIPNTGGATGGIPNTGGAPTGGRQNTGGVPTGGIPNTGGVPTGGIPNTGGVPTGGIPNTGGVPTGGVAGTGGAGGYPGNPLNVPLTGTSISGITAAAWEPVTQKFYLLRPSARQYYALSTTGVVSAAIPLSGSGGVATRVFGVKGDDVYFVSGSPPMLFRQSISTGSASQVQLLGSSIIIGTLTGARAGAWFLIADTSGSYQALADGSAAFTTGTTMNNAHALTTDGAGFAFRTFGASNNVVVHRIPPGTFASNQTPCDTAAFGSLTLDGALGVYGSNIAWVYRRPFDSLYELHVATIGSDGKCISPLQTNFGNNNAGSQVVGLIDTIDALVNPTRAGSDATIEIRRAGDQTFSRTPTTVNTGTGSPIMFVVAAESTPHHAVLITDAAPSLVSF